MVSHEDFQKLEFRVGTILSAERVSNSQKLLKLSVNLGTETRQIIAGIGTTYEPEALLNTQIVVIANLEPRMLMGLESQGMLLAASTDKGPVLISPRTLAPEGSTIH